ncbi:putative nadph dehydrogenase [Phaeomoniella chlamydospora]|uniref:Putative nadph dehydrogenase n=1 Tax=Phaeomoniella chlamydospora TaxID=158046 RepID=A0A0G2FTH3_PHACM|nr:putative nadph dehydrogenase [Phaeomoniella chlamydospora]
MSSHNLQKEASELGPNYPDIPNKAAKGISYYTPTQEPPAGTAIDQEKAAKLFKPLKIRGLELQNRIFGQKIMIQLAHAGRKGSTVAPWLAASEMATEKNNGWPSKLMAPSAIPFAEQHATPSEMTKKDIEGLKEAFVAATRRALKARFDAIEIHNAHGYLLHEFLSPVSNRRTDEYGGSFENRTRLTLEIVDSVRKEIPDDMPLFLRVSADDWLSYEGSPFTASWTKEDTVKLAPLLAEHGVDFLDVSSGGIHPSQKIKGGPSYQAPFALAVKKAVGDKLLVSAVGAITSGPQANALLDEGLDAVFIGRYFQKEPGLVWRFAEELETPIKVANQIAWGFGGRAGKKTH